MDTWAVWLRLDGDRTSFNVGGREGVEDALE
jgi:hypothetical protein